MSHENGASRGLWPAEEQLVPLHAASGTDTTIADRAEERLVPVPEVGAGEFTPERIVRGGRREPEEGWRRAIFTLSGGRIAPGPSTEERRRRDLVARVKTPVSGCRKIAFISRKGGVGKTSTCLLVGHTFATYRGDRVIAVDGNPDAGTLGHRVRRETTANLTTLLADAERVERYADIRGYTSQAPSRLEIVASDDDPQITQAIGEGEFRRIIHLLERHYNLVCLDTGTGVLESATQGILAAADQIVVVSAPSLDGARAASSTLDWLETNGHRPLVDKAIAVINGVRNANGIVDIDRIEEHFVKRCRACVRIPWDPHLEVGSEATLDELNADTQRAVLDLTAAIGSGFADSTG